MPEWPENRSHSDPLATGKGVPAPPKTLPRTRHISLPTLVRGRAARSPFVPGGCCWPGEVAAAAALVPAGGSPVACGSPALPALGPIPRASRAAAAMTLPLPPSLPHRLWVLNSPHRGLVRGAAGWGRAPKTLGEGGTQWSRTPSCTPSPPRHPLPSLPRVRGKKPRNVHFQRSFGCKSVYTWRGKIFLSCRVGIFIE